MRDPAATLVPPVAEELIPQPVDTFLHIGDLISLGHWAMVAIDKMGGPNIPQEVGEWFAGDWSEVMEASDALTHLGEFCTAASEGISDDLTALAASWDGRAAGAAETYFTELADALGTQSSNFADIAHQYRATAFGVKEFANAVGSLVESLADYAIAAGISLAAAAATSWTGIGALAGGGAAAYSIVRGAQTVKQILDIRAKVWTACEALLGLIAGTLGSVKGFTTIALPSAYDNTSVTR